MAGKAYMDGLWVSQGNVAQVNEEVTDFGVSPQAGAQRQFVAGQVGKKINLPNPTNSGSLYANEYQYVHRDDSTTLNAVPCVMQWADPTGTGYFSVELADGAHAVAGVFLGDDVASNILDRGMQDGNYGFIQVGGAIQVLAGGVCTQGADLTADKSGLVLDRTAFSEALVGIALESATTSDLCWTLLSLAHVD